MSKIPEKQPTPGPWKMNGDHHIYGPQAEPTTICATVYRPADARLIAAAPDLLAACKGALQHLNLISEEREAECYLARQALRDAIKKAEFQ